MIVSLPCQALKDGAAAATARHSKILSRTPALKQLIEAVLYQPKQRSVARRDSKERETVKPEEEKVIATVDHSVAALEQKQVVKAIAGHLISILDDTACTPEFEGKQIPSISIHDYVDRLIRYVDAWAGDKPSMASTGVSAALLGVEYLDRLSTGISPQSVHRLYMCAVLVAVKFTEDFSISNRFWAKVAGIDLCDMNRMELAFCGMLEWKLQVSREDFESQQTRFAEPVF
jgi:hypothetical protein